MANLDYEAEMQREHDLMAEAIINKNFTMAMVHAKRYKEIEERSEPHGTNMDKR